LISKRGQTLAEVLAERRARFPSSGEINFHLADAGAALAAVRAHYIPKARAMEEIDGLGLDFGDWRFNLRASNTEPLVRLNVEGRNNPDLVAQMAKELGTLIRTAGGAA
jgi:phosphomannomutase